MLHHSANPAAEFLSNSITQCPHKGHELSSTQELMQNIHRNECIVQMALELLNCQEGMDVPTVEPAPGGGAVRWAETSLPQEHEQQRNLQALDVFKRDVGECSKIILHTLAPRGLCLILSCEPILYVEMQRLKASWGRSRVGASCT